MTSYGAGSKIVHQITEEEESTRSQGASLTSFQLERSTCQKHLLPQSMISETLSAFRHHGASTQFQNRDAQ